MGFPALFLLFFFFLSDWFFRFSSLGFSRSGCVPVWVSPRSGGCGRWANNFEFVSVLVVVVWCSKLEICGCRGCAGWFCCCARPPAHWSLSCQRRLALEWRPCCDCEAAPVLRWCCFPIKSWPVCQFGFLLPIDDFILRFLRV